jgi:16S rRNA (guanine527-N7)-methyltransferase
MHPLLLRNFPKLPSDQAEQLVALESIFLDWNSKINLISRKDTEHFFLHHVLHSLSLVKRITNKPKTILDIGTGGGFPGIPLAIVFPDVQFTLVDSIQKKIKVVQSIVDTLELKNVQTKCCRIEEHKGSYDTIVSRAVAPTRQLLQWSKHLCIPKKTNYYFLKGGDLSEELQGIVNCRIYAIRAFYEDEFFETKKIIHIKK